MNLNDFKYFQKLSESKSFSDTAHYYNVSQPTITYALKRLENEYDTKLVERKSYANSLSLTFAGEQLLEHIKRILHEENLAQIDLNHLKEKKLRMGLPPIITNFLIPQVFDDLKEAKYLHALNPVVGGSKELLGLLRKGEIDCSLLGSLSLIQDSDLKYKVLRTHQFKIIASKKRKFKKDLKLDDLVNEDFILLNEQSIHRQVFDNLVRKYNVSPNVIFETGDYKLLLDLVRDDDGISFISETAINNYSDIQEIDIPDLEMPPFYILIVYRSSTVKDPDFKKLIDIFRNV